MHAAAGFSTAFVDPYAALRSKQPLPTDPEGSESSFQVLLRSLSSNRHWMSKQSCHASAEHWAKILKHVIRALRPFKQRQHLQYL